MKRYLISSQFNRDKCTLTDEDWIGACVPQNVSEVVERFGYAPVTPWASKGHIDLDAPVRRFHRRDVMLPVLGSISGESDSLYA